MNNGNVSPNEGKLGIHWGNAPLTSTSPYCVFSYPVNFVNTVGTDSWPMQSWTISVLPFPFGGPVPYFVESPALISPMEGSYPAVRKGAVNAWHLGSPDGWDPGDRFVFSRDSGTCKTHELGVVHLWDGFNLPVVELQTGDALWAQSGAIWDLPLTPTRHHRGTYWEPRGVGAAALPIAPMVLRFDEVARNAAQNPNDPAPLDHELYWAGPVPNDPASCGTYVWPARHTDCGSGSSSVDPEKPSQGAWLRLKADFDDSAYSPQAKVIIRTLKTRGMVYGDSAAPANRNGIFAEPAGCQAVGGSTVALTDASKCWTPDTLNQLAVSNRIGLDQFEVIDPTSMRLDPSLVSTYPAQDPPDLWKCKPTFDCG